MNKWLNRDNVLILITFVTRLPFLFNEYGIDPDAWWIARTALRLTREGVYEVSRLPGYPIPEFAAVALVPTLGAVGMNVASALLGCASVLLFKRIAMRLGAPQPGLAALAFGFVPVVFLNGVCGMDFAWSLCFFLAAWLGVLSDRPIWAGVWLGCAIGSRITYGAALVPFAFMLWDANRAVWFRRVARLTVPTLTVGLIAFLPVLWVYGLGFFSYYPVQMNLVQIVWKATVGPFGLIGLVALAVWAVAFWRAPVKNPAFTRFMKIAFACQFVLYVIAFLKLPDDPGYLLPLIPFLVIILFTTVGEKARVAIASLFVLSPFLFHVYKDGFHLGGPALYDAARRKRTNAYLEAVVASDAPNQPGAAIVAGYYTSELLVRYYMIDKPYPTSFIANPRLEVPRLEKGPVFYLRDQKDYYANTLGFDLSKYGARELEL